MKLYTTDLCSYEGMDIDTVIRLRLELGRETVFIDKEVYDLAIEQARNF